MATATVAREPVTANERIVHPLVRLRQAIRAYVTIEGLALGVVSVCLWFWATLLFDWGMFKLFGVDYVRDGGAAVQFFLRSIFLLSLLAGLAIIVGYKMIYPLLASLRRPALALVYERRFPERLEDRLVTAVELGDPEVAAQYGYSPAMIEQTRRDAAERVADLPLRQVLHWRRLAKWCGLALVLFLSVIVFFVMAADVAVVWLERDLLLKHRFWPTRSMLSLQHAPQAVPFGGEARVGLRALKWVVADRDRPEGWRPARWEDLWADGRTPRELQGLSFPRAYYDMLPDSWRALPLDQVEVRIRAAEAAASGSTAFPEVEVHWQELGGAVLDRLRQAQAAGATRLDELHARLLPDAWESLAPEQLDGYLSAARRLTPADLSSAGRPTDLEGLQWQLAFGLPVQFPVVSAAVAERVPNAPPLGLDAGEREALPKEWRDLPAVDLAARLQEFNSLLVAERLGRGLVNQLAVLFDELDERASRTSLARRRQFRQLDVPGKATIESEQMLTTEERQYARPKLGSFEVRKQPGGNDFLYDFKKVERPTRFRAKAGDSATPWSEIDVVPLPSLKSLVRYQIEPGYLHGSNEPVTVGPFAVALEGEESRFDVRAGSRLRLEAESYKPLRWVRVIPEGKSAFSLWSKLLGHALGGELQPLGGVELAAAGLASFYEENENPFVKKLTHGEGEAVFGVEFHEIGGLDARLRFEFEDTDGIVSGRKLHVAAVQDQKPEFVHAGFEIVRREMITNQAIIPFSGRVRDEHALTRLEYEVRVLKIDGGVVETQRFPLRRFGPLRLAEGRADSRFEGRSQVTLPRLLAGPNGSLSAAYLSLARLPLAGPVAFHQSPGFELAKEHSFELPVRPGNARPLADDDEYLDTAWLQPPPGADKPTNPLPAPPYRLSINLVARDNFAGKDESGQPVQGQENRNPEAFDFLVVNEEDLLIDAGRREEDIRDRFESIIAGLKSGRKLLKTLQDDYDELRKEAKPDAFRKAKGDADEVLRTVREGRDAVDREVLRELRLIYKELLLNRCRAPVLEQLDQKICRPLEATFLPEQHFARAEESLATLAGRLDAEREKMPPAALQLAVERLDQLISRLEEIAAQLRKLLEYNELLEMLRNLIGNQADVLKRVQEMHKKMIEKELQGDVKPPMKP